MVVGRLTSCSPKQVVELLPARLLRTVLLQQQLLLAPDQIVFVFVLRSCLCLRLPDPR